MDVVTWLVPLILGGGIGAGIVAWARGRSEKKRDRRGRTADAARDAVGDLDALYRNLAQGDGDESELAQAEARASAEVDKCGVAKLSEAFDSWQVFGRRFASGDYDAGEEEYQDLLDLVREGLRTIVDGLS